MWQTENGTEKRTEKTEREEVRREEDKQRRHMRTREQRREQQVKWRHVEKGKECRTRGGMLCHSCDRPHRLSAV